jgi:hypothetical protein
MFQRTVQSTERITMNKSPTSATTGVGQASHRRKQRIFILRNDISYLTVFTSIITQ